MPEHDIKRRASELLQKGRLAEAIQEYKALLEQSKRPNPAIINLIGDIYIKQGNHPAGFSHFLKACHHYADEGLYHNGIAVAKKILRLDKDQVEVYGTLGDLYARQGLGMDAVKFLNEFARRKQEADEAPAALAAFAQACETLIDCPEVNVAYGEMLERVGRSEEAGQNFRRAAESYAARGMSAQVEHWMNRARSMSGEEAPADEKASGDTGVWDMMSLRDLGEKDVDEKPFAPSPRAEKPKRPGSGVHPRSQWGVFDPSRNPSVPPPPPLPSGGTGRPDAPLAKPIAASEVAPPMGAVPPKDALELERSPAKPLVDESSRISLVLEAPVTQDAPESPEAPTAEPDPRAEETMTPSLPAVPGDGLTLDMELPDRPFRAVKGPTSYAEPEPIETVRPGVELDLGPVEPPAPPAPPPPSVTPPPSPRAEQPTAKDEPNEPAGEDEKTIGGRKMVRASLSNLPGIIMPPSAKKREDDDSRGPSRPAHPLSQDPESMPAEPPSREQAIIIGDDTELVREGGDVNEVINDFREATSQILGEDDHQAHYDLGTTYLEMELFDEAASEFEMAAAGTRFALVSQEMLGYCYLRQGHIDRAVMELRKGLELEDYEERAKIGLFYNLGIACGVLGNDADAIDAFRSVESLDPDFRDTRTRLGRLAPRRD